MNAINKNKENTELEKSFYYGFLLDEQELRRIHETIVKQIMYLASDHSTSFTLKFKNNLKAVKTTLDDIFKEENAGQWKIQELKIKVFNKSHSNKISIMLEFKKTYHQSIHYRILGKDRSWVYVTSSLLEERIERVRRKR